MNMHPTRRSFLALTFTSLALSLLVVGSPVTSSAQAAPKKLLVVTTTMGFRHSSIETAEKILSELAKKDGSFTVEFARVNPNSPEFRGNDGKPDKAKIDAAIKDVLGKAMSPDALKKYDGIIFANTTGGKEAGDLPLPDKQAFLDWIKSGKAFIGMHSATDTFRGHQPLDPYVEMIGGEFKTHGAQVEVDCINQDPKHPATAHLPAVFHVKDEIYQLNGFKRDEVHGLLTLDKHPNNKTPGDYPIAWCKMYGKGRVFYTSLGHREDVWDLNTPESFKRENSKEIAEAYQKHVLGGIKWALGLVEGSAEPQTKK